jgi:hypothetical protein
VYDSRVVLELEAGGAPLPASPVTVHMHPTNAIFLTLHAAQLALYGSVSGVRLAVWDSPRAALDLAAAALTAACFSADGQFCYAASADGSMAVFSADALMPLANIAIPEMAPPQVSRDRLRPIQWYRVGVHYNYV